MNIRSKIKKLNLLNRVTLYGKVLNEDLPAYFEGADLFLCMSEHEGFCVPVVEAFNCSLPVVAYLGTAVKETMRGSPGALNSLDVNEAVKKIHEVFADSDFRKQLISHGNKMAKNYTYEAVKENLNSIIQTHIETPLDKEKPFKVSVVICTYNRYDYLKRCLTYLQNQSYPHFEVIVVNGPSTDGTTEYLTTRKDVKVVQNSARNLAISRNLGIRNASGDVIAFIDDDALPYDNWLEEIVKAYQESAPCVGGIGGRTFYANQLFFQFDRGTTDPFGKAYHVPDDHPVWGDQPRYRYLMGTNATFYKKALVKVNGFDQQYDYHHDETDLAVRLQKAGYFLSYADHAYIRHEFAQSHNRRGRYNLNWHKICKNTIYFGLKNAADIASLTKRINVTNKNMWEERILYFWKAKQQGELDLADFLRYSRWSILGTVKGLYDSSFPRKLGNDLQTFTSFLPYLNNSHDSQLASSKPKKNLHVMLISQEFPPDSYGGVGAYNHSLAKELIQMGHKVTVICRGTQDSTQTIGPITIIRIATVDIVDCFPEYPLLSKNLAWAKTAARITQEVHTKHPIDIIESAIWDAEGIGIVMLRPQFTVPLVVRLVTPFLVSIKINQWEITPDFQACAEMEKELVKNADGVIPISQSIQDSFSSTYNVNPDERWNVQFLGVQPWPTYADTSNYGQLPSELQRGEIQLLFVGRLESRKGIDIFIKALKLVMPREPKINVWIAGADIEGWQEKVKEYLDNESLKRVQILGHISEEKRELLYANCDLFVFPSRYESFGLVALEAMVYGKPVIGAKAGAIPEVLIHGECGLLFEPDNHEDLASQIIKVVKDKNLYSKLSKGAKERAELLSSRAMAESSVERYNSIIASGSQPRQSDHPILQKLLESMQNKQDNMPPEPTSQDSQEQQQSISDIKLNHNYHLQINPNWQVTQPKIISWFLLNPLFNRLIVPKLVRFIESVLHQSMLNQKYINEIFLSNQHLAAQNFAAVEQGLLKYKQNLEELRNILQSRIQEFDNILKSKIQEIVEKQFFTYKESLSNSEQNLQKEIAEMRAKCDKYEAKISRVIDLESQLKLDREKYDAYEAKISRVTDLESQLKLDREKYDQKLIL
ncbi:MAG: glycosyltransferase, partial [Cyanobacteria bacterium P01_G01_bin.49]